MHELSVAIAGVLAGAIAAVVGFGIGSLLTPVLALEYGTKAAVAAVAIPHFIGTAQRFWLMRQHLDRRLLLGFGIASALGGLAGALLHTQVSSPALTLVFAALLIFAGITELSGWINRIHWSRRAAWVAGAASGIFGGLVGNQGGIRSAAMLGFDIPRQSFIATATAIGLIVDLARLPVYLATQWQDIVALWPLILIACVAVTIGTVLGGRVLKRIPQHVFRKTIAIILLALGLYMTLAGMRQ